MTILEKYNPTADSVLELEADRSLSQTGTVDGSSVLMVEVNKPSANSIGELNVKSTPIQKPAEIPAVLEKTESSASGASTVNNSYTTNNVSNVNKSINNVLSNLFDSSIGNLINSELTEIANSKTTNKFPTAEKVIDKIAKDTISKEVTDIQKTTSDAFSLVSNSITKNLESTEKSSTNKEFDLTEISQSSTESIGKIVNDLFSQENKVANSTVDTSSKSNTEDLTVKSKKMVDAASVNRILKPENPVQASMEKLTRVLPESINNLNSTVSSINTSSSAGPVTTNEGSRIDQSSNTTIVQGSQPGQPMNYQQPANKPEETRSQMSEHYLQAIYAAIVSGKIKVKLEY